MILYKYFSRTGRNHELTLMEYEEAIIEIRERLEQKMKDIMLTGTDKEKITYMEKISPILKIRF